MSQRHTERERERERDTHTETWYPAELIPMDCGTQMRDRLEREREREGTEREEDRVRESC